MSRSHSSWGEGVFSPPGGVSPPRRRLPPPSPLYVFQYCVWCVAFAFDFCISIRDRHSSFSRGHPSGNARGAKYMCLTHPPVRARNRRGQKETADSLDSGIRNSFSSFTVLFYSSFFLQLRQIASCSCIRDMKKLFYFVVCDFRLF